MAKITKVVLEQSTTEDLIPKLIEFGKTAQQINKFYPSVWAAMMSQYSLYFSKESISENLFEKKLEIMLLQDDELRRK